MAVTPRLLTAAQARKYLGGMDPGDIGVAPAGSVGGELRYDLAALDRRLDERSGLTGSSPGDDADAALKSWLAGHGAS